VVNVRISSDWFPDEDELSLNPVRLIRVKKELVVIN